MTIELKNSGKKNQLEGEIYHLYINGKTDAVEYTSDGEESGMAPWSVKKKHVERIMQVKCADYPDKMTLWNSTNYKLPVGELGLFEIQRRGNKMKMEIWFGFDRRGIYNEKNWPFNPYLLKKKIRTLAKGTILKPDGFDVSSDEVSYVYFKYQTDLNGTIADKFNFAYQILHNLVSKAEGQVIADAKNYLKKKKIKF